MNQQSNEKLGTWVQMNSPTIVEILGNNGFDFIVIDLEHGNISLESLEHLLRAAEVSSLEAFVRVHDNNPSLITKVLDLGPHGIVVPHITTREEAEMVVSFAKYPPLGVRGSCPCTREAQHMNNDWSVFMKKSNKEMKVIALVEGEEGIKNFESIASVEGINALMVGPFDLSVSLGVPGEIEHSLIEEKYSRLIDLTNQLGKDLIGIDFSEGVKGIEKGLNKWRNRSIKTIMTGIDKMIFGQSAREITALKHNGYREEGENSI
jgi:2-keto-3-deoxy-L-rhamnonate aldolase RhmA